ncbi:MAG: branched-chain amino acid ABC transporter permease [Armatimonadota bacterium]|nr:branched-chain amino acid ABC transporter permease [Armatimonadota bacterium]MDR7520241.1 branched-chain amino acid ABC transporter permease [Armatimonadota bacterium]MDR7549423.1 branched-chain amino acid ABC transporter permease [Armatimonadota bacterium]
MTARRFLRPTLLGVGAAAMAVLPVITSRDNVLTLAFLVWLYAALAQSWNLLSGFGGQVNLGLAAFFGLGALITRWAWQQALSVLPALGAGTLAAAVAGLVLGAPGLRLRGPYFAIGTLAVAEILRITVGNLLPEVSTLRPAALVSYSLLPRYYLALGVAGFTTLAAWALTRSRFGYGLAAVREDEEVAEAIGVHAFRHKLLAFVLSSACAGAAGGVFGYYHLSFYPQFAFSPLWTFDAVLIAFLGGVGTVWGPPVGAAFFLLIREALALRAVEVHLLVFGILFIVVVLAFPGGFVEAWRGLARAQRVRPV